MLVPDGEAKRPGRVALLWSCLGLPCGERKVRGTSLRILPPLLLYPCSNSVHVNMYIGTLCNRKKQYFPITTYSTYSAVLRTLLLTLPCKFLPMRAGKQVRNPDWPVQAGESMPSPSTGNPVPRRLSFAAKTGLGLASSAADPGSKTDYYSRLQDG